MKDLLQHAAIGNPITRLGVSFFPIYLIGNELTHVGASSSEHLAVDELDDASVPTLAARNLSKEMLLIAAGQHFVGGLQNRAINISVLIAAMSTVKIPVSCLEQGRWSRQRGHDPEYYEDEDEFDPFADEDEDDIPETNSPRADFVQGGFASRRTRYTVHSNVAPLQNRSGNQSEVWNSIDRELDDLGVDSPTHALSANRDFYRREHRRADAADELVELGPLPGQHGFVVAHGNRPTAIEVFGSPALLKDYWEDLVRSYMLERPTSHGRPSASAALRLLNNFGRAIANAAPQPGVGLGTEIHVANDRAAGHALIYNDAIVHACDFVMN